jgi:peptidoglycan hydrolase-like protein with peptidoglycan-binding domain
MLNRKLRKKSTATSPTDPDHGSRHITGRRAGMIVLALATALAGAAIIAPSASAATGCVTIDFGESNTYQQCVYWEQILLDNLWNAGDNGAVNQWLTQDGYYGPHTLSDVESFQRAYLLKPDGITGPLTWSKLCEIDQLYGFTGVYWHDVGCATL